MEIGIPTETKDQHETRKTMSNGKNDAMAPNAKRLLWAGFMAILAAGIGFGIRGAIFADWVRYDTDVTPEEQLLLCDAQTSGGLLAAVPAWKGYSFEPAAAYSRKPPAMLAASESAWVILAPSRPSRATVTSTMLTAPAWRPSAARA